MVFSRKIGKYARASVAGFMAIWLSGVLFLLCCQKMNGGTMMAEFCPLEKKTSHCNRMKNTDSPVVETSTTHEANCCGFLPVVFDKVRKIEISQSPAQPVAKVVVEPVRFIPSLAIYRSARVFSRMESRQGTYLQNCNFRI
jgi:hypothetical protein